MRKRTLENSRLHSKRRKMISNEFPYVAIVASTSRVESNGGANETRDARRLMAKDGKR
jgi:hypothetical protein